MNLRVHFRIFGTISVYSLHTSFWHWTYGYLW